MVLENQRFERARVLLSEPASVFSGALRSVLRGMGFRHVFQFESVAALRAEFAATGFDLWITNAEMPDGPVFDLVHDIRHSRIGRDIFTPVVVQSLDVTQALAAHTLNAGADLLWRLPTIALEPMGRVGVTGAQCHRRGQSEKPRSSQGTGTGPALGLRDARSRPG